MVIGEIIHRMPFFFDSIHLVRCSISGLPWANKKVTPRGNSVDI